MLLSKLEWYGIAPEWFMSYLSGRRQVVRGGILFLPDPWVPQGSLLGPILFSIFTNDLPSLISHGHISSYANDTQLFDSDTPDNLPILRTRQEMTLSVVQVYLPRILLK